jgi:pimeloyl-ACP methyl ester carboxylesterase
MADLTSLQYEIRGNKEGKTIIFLHGWPDDASLWTKQVPVLEKDFRCVLVTFPNFGRNHDIVGGCNFRHIIARLHHTIEEIAPDQKVILITHDWGAYISYLYEKRHSDRIEKMVTMDVGGHIRPGPIAISLIISYQWTLISLWFLGGVHPHLGTTFTRIFARTIGVPKQRIEKIESKCNYMYYYLWKASFFPFFDQRQELILPYRPKVPILYLYGEQKPFHFHSKQWLKIVEESGGRHFGYPKGDHWFMLTQADDVNQKIKDWI